MNTKEAVVTQNMLNNAVDNLRKEWNQKLKSSGLSEFMFIANDGEATKMLTVYQDLKERVEYEGILSMPIFHEGITIKFVSTDKE